ncbi:MAG: amino acid ABC transporter permease [Clostridia bacterium]|nr:amino acid ABC transporter permease [Clostridia bacterium]MBQ8371274.1 amino acid ABC transporter permease [Clostridia bacterium]MBQ8510987.1 amino acid ABC transporter permease [Clostridia bacterium]
MIFAAITPELFYNVTADLLKHFGQNCLVFLLTLAGAIPLGLIITFGSMSTLGFNLHLGGRSIRIQPIQWITKTWVWIIRGTPLMLQLFVVMYVPGLVFDMPMKSRLTAVLIAFIINYSAYFSEIYRGGIESIAKGQYEAGQVLGMTKSQIFFRIVLFQVIKRIVPPMGNEIITLVKDTSLARVIAYAEIIKSAERYASQGLIWPLFYTGVFFLIFVGVLTIVLGKVEKKLNYYQG